MPADPKRGFMLESGKGEGSISRLAVGWGRGAQLKTFQGLTLLSGGGLGSNKSTELTRSNEK